MAVTVHASIHPIQFDSQHYLVPKYPRCNSEGLEAPSNATVAWVIPGTGMA